MRYERYDRRYYRDDDWNPRDTLLASAVPKALTVIAFVLLIAIVLGTVFALTARRTSVGHNYRAADPSPQKVINLGIKANNRVDAYTDIGQLRLTSRPADEDSEGSVVVIAPWFSYPEGDASLFEELSRKERQIKALIGEYVSTYTKEQLLAMGERKIKDDLLDQINERLVLGKIRDIYFDQYLFFE